MTIRSKPSQLVNTHAEASNEEAINRFIEGAPDGGGRKEPRKAPTKSYSITKTAMPSQYKQMTVTLTLETSEAITEYCAANRLSRNEFVRDAINQKLKRLKRRKDE